MLEFGYTYEIKEILEPKALEEILILGPRPDDTGLGTALGVAITIPNQSDAAVIECFVAKASKLSPTRWHLTADPLVNDNRIEEDGEFNNNSIVEVTLEVDLDYNFISGNLKFTRVDPGESKLHALTKTRFH